MTTQLFTKKGFFITIGRKAVFLETPAETKSKKIVFAMIKAIGTYRGLCAEWIERCQNDPETYKRIQHDMAAATLELKDTNGDKWYTVSGHNFGGGYDTDEIIIA